MKPPPTFSPFARWDTTHDPDARPLGCNGRYGNSGREKHRARNEQVCDKCRDSFNHYRRELARGQNLARPENPCGTPAAAARHRRNNERVCLKCRLAQNKNNQKYKAAKKAASLLKGTL